MRETIEFRIPEEHAARYLRPEEGISLGGSVRKYELETSEPRFHQIGQFDRELKAQGRAFFTAWTQRRRYSRREVDGASLFRLKVRSVFEPAGEECGTKHDESAACPRCSAGAKQVGPLFLNLKQVPKGKNFAKTIAGEIVVSRRVGELFKQHSVTGVDLLPVRVGPATSAESKEWFVFKVQSAEAEIVAPTRAGNDPFDDDPKGEYRCPLGDLIGLTLLSEVAIKSATRGHADIICTRQFIGARLGLLRPERIILVSPKVRLLLESEKLFGCEVEVAHLT